MFRQKKLDDGQGKGKKKKGEKKDSSKAKDDFKVLENKKWGRNTAHQKTGSEESPEKKGFESAGRGPGSTEGGKKKKGLVSRWSGRKRPSQAKADMVSRPKTLKVRKSNKRKEIEEMPNMVNCWKKRKVGCGRKQEFEQRKKARDGLQAGEVVN